MSKHNNKSVDKFGLQFKKQFEQIDYTNIYNIIRNIVQSSIEENFIQDGRYGSGRFGGGKTRWQISRRVKKHGGQTLQKSAQLAASIRVNIHAGNNTPRQIVIEAGSNKPYAAIHNFGGNISVTDKMKNYFKYRFYNAKTKKDKAKWGGLSSFAENHSIIKMPARPFLVLQDEDIGRINAVIIKHLGRVLR